jgi:hypothetical protein
MGFVQVLRGPADDQGVRPAVAVVYTPDGAVFQISPVETEREARERFNADTPLPTLYVTGPEIRAWAAWTRQSGPARTGRRAGAAPWAQAADTETNRLVGGRGSRFLVIDQVQPEVRTVGVVTVDEHVWAKAAVLLLSFVNRPMIYASAADFTDERVLTTPYGSFTVHWADGHGHA